MKKKLLNSLIIVFSLIIGGCNSVGKTKEKAYINSGNVIDVEAAKEAGFEEYKPLTPKEIVFDEDYDDKRLTYAKENWKQIKEVSENYIRSIAKRDDVEVFSFNNSGVHGNIIEVKYRTTSVPEMIGSADVVWDEEGNFGVREMYEKEIEILEVNALFNYAFSDELNELRDAFSKEFTEFIPMSVGSIDALNYGMTDEYFAAFTEIQFVGEERQRIHDLFYASPEMSKEELKEIFINQSGKSTFRVALNVNLIARSIDKKPSEKDVNKIEDFLLNYKGEYLEFTEIHQILVSNLHRPNTSIGLYRILSGYTSPNKYTVEWN